MVTVGRDSQLRPVVAALAFMASLLLCLLPTTVLAAPVDLNEILDRDPLGYKCVPSQYFDEDTSAGAALAFTLSGKTRLPRTCLPDPCARALTRQELSQITGTEPILASFSAEWDDYYSRYADTCVREITVSRPPKADFWKPILRNANNIQRLGLPTSSRFRPFILGPEGQRILLPIRAGFTDKPIDDGFGPKPSPVPLPASGMLLGVGLIGAVALRRRRVKR